MGYQVLRSVVALDEAFANYSLIGSISRLPGLNLRKDRRKRTD